MFLYVLASGVLAAGADQPPNVVMVLADDQGWGDVGYNNMQYQDPSYKVGRTAIHLLIVKIRALEACKIRACVRACVCACAWEPPHQLRVILLFNLSS